MQQEDELRALAKIMDFLRAVSIILVVMNVYWYCYATVEGHGINIGVVDFVFITIFVVPIGGCGVCFGTFVSIFGASPDCFEFDLLIINTIL